MDLLPRTSKAGIYRIIVKGLGNYYGESDNITKRWNNHRKLLRQGKHHNNRLQEAYNLLGTKGLIYEILEYGEELHRNKHYRLAREAYYIATDPSAINVKGVEDTYSNDQLPPRQCYLRRYVYLIRVGRSQLAQVRANTKDGELLGTELMHGKWRTGLFWVDRNGNLKRKREKRNGQA